ncbi:MAG TPA: hypothetical protein VII17_00065 [Steroidobacteraceae bacterium]
MVSVLPQGGDFGRADMLNDPISKRPGSVAVVVLLCAGLAGCAMHWPWRHRPPPAPQPVQELSIQPQASPAAAAPAQILQFWDRNTLLLDLTALRGDGAVTLTPVASRGWPIRLEFRVQPGSVARLEVQGRERIVFEVPEQGAPVVFKLVPDAYVRDTPQITVRWNGAGDSAR